MKTTRVLRDGNANQEPDMLAQSHIIERGWTKTMITRLLGEPDKLKVNPHGPKGPKMRMYLTLRVIDAETTKEFVEAKSHAALRSERAVSNAIARREALMREIHEIEIEVPLFDDDDLIRRSIHSYNALWESRGKYASLADSPEFLERIAVNYLRHRCSRYEAEFERVHGHVGADAARYAIRCRVYRAIADTYPDLADECNRQLSVRQG